MMGQPAMQHGESIFPMLPVPDPSLLGVQNQLKPGIELPSAPPQMFAPNQIQPIIQKVVREDPKGEKVPGSQGIGLIPGSTCEICPEDCAKLSVSICNYSMKYFQGCNKAFCNMHGVGHFTMDMIDPSYLKEERLLEMGLSESDVKFFNELHKERREVSNNLMFIRFCRDCEPQYTAACKK